MKGQKGIAQMDIAKVKKFLRDGHTCEEIANGMLGYRCPVGTIESFKAVVDEEKTDAKKKMAAEQKAA